MGTRTIKGAKQQVPAAAVEGNADSHAEVWRMLLLELWDQPCSDPAVVCSLLCVSKAMSALVHDTCRGKLVVRIKQQQLSTDSEAALTCSWLAKHAQLLQELQVHFSEGFDYRIEWVAAGLRAAAGVLVPSMQPACRTWAQWRTPAVQAIQSAEDTAAAAMKSAAALSTASSMQDKQQDGVHQLQVQPQQQVLRKRNQPVHQRQMLPLLRFSMEVCNVLSTTMTYTLPAACMQLTQLAWKVPGPGCVYFASPPPWLQQLRGLRELVMECDVLISELGWLHNMKQLTKLHLSFVHGLTTSELPVSVVDLALCHEDVDESKDLRGLTNLSSLQCSRVLDPIYLPGQLQLLVMNHIAWHEGYLQLQELRCLKFERDHAYGVPDLLPFSRMTKLTALRLVVDVIMSEDDWGFSEMCKVLPQLPLVQLHVRTNPLHGNDITFIVQCTKLTSLLLCNVYAKVDVGVIAEQLQNLQGLQELTWDRVQLRPHWGDPIMLNPLVDAFRALAGKSLRSVYFRGIVLSDEQEERLQQALGEGWDYQPEQIDSESLWGDS